MTPSQLLALFRAIGTLLLVAVIGIAITWLYRRLNSVQELEQANTTLTTANQSLDQKAKVTEENHALTAQVLADTLVREQKLREGQRQGRDRLNRMEASDGSTRTWQGKCGPVPDDLRQWVRDQSASRR